MYALLPGVLSLLLLLQHDVRAQDAGTFSVAANTQVSAMMMFAGNTDKVYILDKAQGNAATINGHSAWASVWDLNSGNIDLLELQTNTFCSSGVHLPNGSFAVFGGNSAVKIGGGDPAGLHWDPILNDFDGNKSIRILSPCLSTDDITTPACQWFEDTTQTNAQLQMQAMRWYSTAEALGDGTSVLIGGFQNGGYILRLFGGADPTIGASLSYEYFPNVNNKPLQNLQFLFKTSGLNAYAHAYLMASGKIFLQANLSTTLWDHENNLESDLPDMPNGVVRVYPGSGATAMLPMTPANNWTQTVIFCGGSDMPDADWGNFSWPFIDTWNYPASRDCQRITPEGDGQYSQDDNMPIGRTMGQFIILPDGQLLVVNGGANGTAGYSDMTLTTTNFADMPFQQSLASAPVLTPAIYDPNAKSGSRWSTAGLSASQIPRLYHSSALLLPDGSVMIAGSNPNFDVNITDSVTFKTEYRAEKFYPPYFSGVKPKATGIPSSLSYGGASFDITVSSNSYAGKANDAAASAQVNVLRPGWTTHGMNMGQRFLQLNNTYTVNTDGTITLHCAQMPANANLFQPGPAFVFVVINGVPSNATYTIVGSGQIGVQPLSDIAQLPPSSQAADTVTGNGSAPAPAATKSWFSQHVALIAAIVGIVAALALLGVSLGLCLARRRKAKLRQGIAAGKARFPPPPVNVSAAAGNMYSDQTYAPVPPRSPYGGEHDRASSQVWLREGHSESGDWTPAHSAQNSAIFEPEYGHHPQPGGGFPQPPYSDRQRY